MLGALTSQFAHDAGVCIATAIVVLCFVYLVHQGVRVPKEHWRFGLRGLLVVVALSAALAALIKFTLIDTVRHTLPSGYQQQAERMAEEAIQLRLQREK
jgi:hypothetical protein